MKKTEALEQRCRVFQAKDGKSFVGIQMKQDRIHVTFPLGFLPEQESEVSLRKEILLLFHVLQRYSTQALGATDTDGDELFEFPVLSYQYLVLSYLQKGYYTEFEKTFASANRGKICWKRTLQQKKPVHSQFGPVYLDFVTSRTITSTETILAKIHEYCVYESFLKIGWLYSDILPEKPQLKFQKDFFLSILHGELTNSFQDEKKLLLRAMVQVVNAVGEQGSFSKEMSLGTDSFDLVWETMIDETYGSEKKEQYFPKSKWILESGETFPSSPLKPDTIIKLDSDIYIVDAKYYSYGVTLKPKDLPPTSSIHKQITYGEHLAYQKIYGKIYNAFVMPCHSSNEDFYKFIGVANADWKEGDKPYENVIGILLDTRHLMSLYLSRDKSEVSALSQLIFESVAPFLKKNQKKEQEATDTRISQSGG